jgi:hypothetical protein
MKMMKEDERKGIKWEMMEGRAEEICWSWKPLGEDSRKGKTVAEDGRKGKKVEGWEEERNGKKVGDDRRKGKHLG